MSTFTLPETRAALAQWQDITGLGTSSPEWGEVLQVLRDTGLLAADAEAQHGLFDDPELPPGELPQARQLRLAILGGALLHRSVADRRPSYDVATCTAIVAALLTSFYEPGMDGLTFEQAAYRLEVEAPLRTREIAVAPAIMLKWLMDGAAIADVDSSSLLSVVVGEAFDSDEFALRVFARTAADPRYFLALAPLCTGGWLLYDSSPSL